MGDTHWAYCKTITKYFTNEKTYYGTSPTVKKINPLSWVVKLLVELFCQEF